jgi:hypothetical protein
VTTPMSPYMGMQIADAYHHPAGVVLEVRAVGHRATRLILVEGISRVTDITDYRAERDAADLAQHDDDLGDEMHERERFADHDIDIAPQPPEHSRRPW